MLSDAITLSVDAANNSSPANQVFGLSDRFQNRSVYKGPAHTLISRDTLGFYRGTITKSGNFNGVAKSSCKFTKDIEVPGVDQSTTVMAPMILEISFSLPVGTTAAEAMEMRQRAIALLDSDTHMITLTEQLEV